MLKATDIVFSGSGDNAGDAQGFCHSAQQKVKILKAAQITEAAGQLHAL